MVLQLTAENTLNSVTNQVTYDSETGGRTTLPVNMNGNWQTQGSFSLSTPFKNKHWLIRTYSCSAIVIRMVILRLIKKNLRKLCPSFNSSVKDLL